MHAEMARSSLAIATDGSSGTIVSLHSDATPVSGSTPVDGAERGQIAAMQ
jgi:hypothetical protein